MINRENLRRAQITAALRDSIMLMAIAAAIDAILMLCFQGCSTQPPPPPVVVQAAPTPAPTPITPDPYAGLSPDVAFAIKHNETPTLHHGITTVYPYSPDLQYPLNCHTLRVTQIRLRPDETTDKDDVKVGDKDRWGVIIGDHTVLVFPLGSDVPITVPGAQQTIPRDPNMITNLVIHTSLGNDYVFNPIRIGKPFTQAVEFYYPDQVRAEDAARRTALKEQKQ